MKLLRPILLLLVMAVLVGAAVADEIDPYIAIQSTAFSGCGSIPCKISGPTPITVVGPQTFTFGSGRIDFVVTNNSGFDWHSLTVTVSPHTVPVFNNSYPYTCFDGGISTCTVTKVFSGPNLVGFKYSFSLTNPIPHTGTLASRQFHILAGPTPEIWQGDPYFTLVAPEPASMLLLGAGLLGVGFFRRRK